MVSIYVLLTYYVETKVLWDILYVYLVYTKMLRSTGFPMLYAEP
jgi:hypothetical protein